jgi:hypothetical protein
MKPHISAPMAVAVPPRAPASGVAKPPRPNGVRRTGRGEPLLDHLRQFPSRRVSAPVGVDEPSHVPLIAAPSDDCSRGPRGEGAVPVDEGVVEVQEDGHGCRVRGERRPAADPRPSDPACWTAPQLPRRLFAPAEDGDGAGDPSAGTPVEGEIRGRDPHGYGHSQWPYYSGQANVILGVEGPIHTVLGGELILPTASPRPWDASPLRTSAAQQ